MIGKHIKEVTNKNVEEPLNDVERTKEKPLLVRKENEENLINSGEAKENALNIEDKGQKIDVNAEAWSEGTNKKDDEVEMIGEHIKEVTNITKIDITPSDNDRVVNKMAVETDKDTEKTPMLGCKEIEKMDTLLKSREMKKTKKKKPGQVLGTLIKGLLMAFAWRAVFTIIIEEIVGETSSGKPPVLWSYAIIVYLLSTVLLSLGDIFGSVIKGTSCLEEKVEAVEYVGSILDASLKFIVALAFSSGFQSLFAYEDPNHKVTACWVYCGIMLLLMVLTTIYVKKLLLKISEKFDG